jgi:hypothetical protein
MLATSFFDLWSRGETVYKTGAMFAFLSICTLGAGCGGPDAEIDSAQVTVQLAYPGGMPPYLGPDPNAFECDYDNVVINTDGAVKSTFFCYGNISYSGGRNPSLTSQLDAMVLDDLKNRVLEADLFSCKDDYTSGNVQDCSGGKLTVDIDGKRKEIAVDCGLPRVPQRVVSLINLITGFAAPPPTKSM